MKPRHYVPKRPALHGYLYCISTPDVSGITIGVTRWPEHRFLQYRHVHGDYDLLGLWMFGSWREAEVVERSLKNLMRDGLIHGVVIPSPGRWTESMVAEDFPLVEGFMTDAGVVRVSWPDSGPFHGCSKDLFLRNHGYRWTPLGEEET